MANKKYSEDKTLEEISQYIEGTYSQHYVGIDEIQTLDVWESLGIADAMCVGTAIKYLMRFGKKEGRNRKDILKSIHFLVLLLHYEDKRTMQEMIENAKRSDRAKKKFEEEFPKDPEDIDVAKAIKDAYDEAVKKVQDENPYVQTFIIKNRPNL